MLDLIIVHILFMLKLMHLLCKRTLLLGCYGALCQEHTLFIPNLIQWGKSAVFVNSTMVATSLPKNLPINLNDMQ